MKIIRTRQRGAALVMGLILLVVITLLAVVGMNIANTELASATGEQLRLRAFNAAESGIEARLQTLREDATTSTVPVVSPTEGVENSPLNTVTDEPADSFTTTTVFRGEGSMLDRYSAGTFVGFHYSVESTGSRLKCLRNSGRRDDFIQMSSRFPRLTAPTPLARLKEIITFLHNLPAS